MTLETMAPPAEWDASGQEDAIDTFRTLREDLTIKVWGGDWCKDCRATLPEFAGALAAAGIDPSSVEHHAVEKASDGSKRGPKVDAFDIERIPTIVIERAGVERARFVEEASVPPAVHLAAQLTSAESEPVR